MPISNAYNQDCMIGMKEFPDKFFELAVVDPPYGIKMNYGNGSLEHNKAFRKQKKNWDNERPSAEYFSELFRVSKNQIVWGANYFTEFLPASMGWVMWYKTDECKGRCFGEGEVAYTSFDRALRHFELKPFQRDGSRMHPTQKPIALYQWLLKNYAKPGDKILDTHLGSGSSRIAAYKMGFDFWGYEIDKDYFEAQEKRFKTAIAEPLFEQVKVEQGKLI
jgi:site-specific DNA-methyltransferase (adenine-specific)